MFDNLASNYKYTDRKIKVLTNLLAILAIALFGSLLHSLYKEDYVSSVSELGLLSASIGGLIVSLVASRHLTYEEIRRESDRRSEIVMVTHHFIAITNDLEGRVYYVGEFIKKMNRPIIMLDGIAQTIERRYETLLEQSSYKHLPGKSVNRINELSGSIYGLNKVIELLLYHFKDVSPDIKVLLGGEDGWQNQLDQIQSLCREISQLREDMIEIREGLES